MALNDIKQTSKTILFEEFCKESSENAVDGELCPDLFTLLNNNKNSDFLTESVLKKLEVSTYQEFVEKFTPCIWESMTMVEGESTPRFTYSVEKPLNDPRAKKVQLSTHEFYKMVMNLYSKKAVAGENNHTFDYSMVEELLSPEKVMDEAKKLRKALHYNYSEYLKLDESRQAEQNERAERIIQTREAITQKYDNVSAVIKLALGDTKEKLLLLEKGSQGEENLDAPKLEVTSRPCLMEFSETGDITLVPVEMKTEDTTALAVVDQATTDIATVIGDDYDDATEGQGNTYIRSLVTTLFVPNDGNTGLVTLNREELVAKRDQYTYVYKNMQEQFVKAISSVVEKMLNVKVFFDNATVDGKLKSPLVVSNCKASDLLEDDSTKENFRNFLQQSGDDRDGHKLWFAILPAIGDKEFLDATSTNINPMARNPMGKKETPKKGNQISIDVAKEMLKILEEYRIVTFFNYKASEKTGFHQFQKEMVVSYKQKLENLQNNPYAVFSYPNFTVLPKKETNIQIGETGEGENEKRQFLELPGIYVDASYVAAGLVVGTQDRDYLKNKGFDVNPANPCVRFDLEEDDYRYRIQTTMNREGHTTWANGIEEEVNLGEGKLFGFCFCGNTKYSNGKKVEQTYIHSARNMTGKSICTTLVKDFVRDYLALEMDMTSKNLNKFVNTEADQWRLDSTRNPVANSMLKEGELIELVGDTMKISLKGNDLFVDLNVEVTES